jgi:hypothetical protein
MEEAWSVPGVYLLSEGPAGDVAVPQLTLTIVPDGIALAKDDGEPVWSCPWEQLEELSPVERAVLPDGGDGVVIVVVERGKRRHHRFALATDDAAATEASIIAHAAAYGLRTKVSPASKAPVSRALTVLIVFAAMATMTVLLLSATHVISF